MNLQILKLFEIFYRKHEFDLIQKSVKNIYLKKLPMNKNTS